MNESQCNMSDATVIRGDKPSDTLISSSSRTRPYIFVVDLTKSNDGVRADSVKLYQEPLHVAYKLLKLFAIDYPHRCAGTP